MVRTDRGTCFSFLVIRLRTAQCIKMAKRTNLSLSFKMDIIKKFDEKCFKSKTALADHFRIPESTLRGILKNKEDINAAYLECGIKAKKRSRIQSGKNEEFEKVLVLWFKETRASNIPVNVELLREKALELSKSYDMENFSASKGWVEKFKIRHGLSTRVLSGESGSVNIESVEQWQKDLPDLVKEYEPKNIYNCDETGLFYRVMPDRTLAFKGEPCHGGKKSVERLTVLLCCNADGSDKLPPLVIGKSKNPRCFKNVKKLPCDYASNKTAWMTSGIFLDFLHKFDSKMEKEKRKVILFMDQCPAHPKDLPSLNYTKVMFFPANCTSKLQPMDLSIIRCVKVHYRKTLIRRLLASIEMKRSVKDDLKQITVLDAIHMVCSSWTNITDICIKNCFKKAGFLLPEEKECEDDKDTQSESDVSEDDWNAVSGGLVSCTFSEFVDVDETLITSEMRDISDIATEIGDNKYEDVEDDEGDTSKVPPTHTTAFEALETLREYFQFNSGSERTFSHLDELEKTLIDSSRKQKQTFIDDFFVKKM